MIKTNTERWIILQNTLTPKRLEWLDALRGLAMVYVALGHCMPGGMEKHIFILLTSPVKLPLFFAVSGYVFNSRDGKQGAFFANLLRKIMIPSLVFVLCTLLIGLPKRGLSHLATGFWDFLSGELYWYIPACILGEILFFYNLKVSTFTL